MKLNLNNHIGLALGVLLLASCSRDPDSSGYEYMPDMYRSQAIEAYVDYGMVSDDEYDALKTTISARVPAFGTIPFYDDKTKASIMMPYDLPGTDEGYNQSKSNTIPVSFIETEEIAMAYAEEGKTLYSYMCQHCHGEKGGGDGGVVTVGQFNAPLPYSTGYKDRELGQIFHVITHGKGAMGSHASQLNKEERWKVALYVRTLQNEGDLKFNEINTVVDTLSLIDQGFADSILVMPDSIEVINIK